MSQRQQPSNSLHPYSDLFSREVVVAPDSDLHEICGAPPDVQILPGRPIPLALNPATNNLVASAQFQSHRLVRNRYFFTLPRGLWDEVFKRIGKERFDAEADHLEESLGEICGDHSANAGLWKGRAFSFAHLHWVPVPRVSAAAMGWDIKQAKLDRELRIVEQRSIAISSNSRGYLGWLLTNPCFLDEHDALLGAHVDPIREWGTASFGLNFLPGELDRATPEQQAEFRTADVQFVDFFCRWRLQGLAAPYLPVPLQPLMAGNLPQAVLSRYLRTGGVFVIPDVFPVPSRDEFRSMLEQSLRGLPPDHLAPWMTIIASNNSAKQAIVRFARLFELQHFWRVLHHRHRAGVRRKTTVLKQVFASFLRTSEQMIHKDIIEIKRRLGADWVERGANYPLGPF